jgi:hypothetical protein
VGVGFAGAWVTGASLVVVVVFGVVVDFGATT